MKLEIAVASIIATKGLSSSSSLLSLFAVEAKVPVLQERRTKVIDTIPKQKLKPIAFEKRKRALQKALKQRQLTGSPFQEQQGQNKDVTDSEGLDLGIIGSTSKYGKTTENENTPSDADEEYHRHLDEEEPAYVNSWGYYLEYYKVRIEYLEKLLRNPYGFTMETYCTYAAADGCNTCEVNELPNGSYSIKYDCPNTNVVNATLLEVFESGMCSPLCDGCSPICGYCNTDPENSFVDNQNCTLTNYTKALLGLDLYYEALEESKYYYDFVKSYLATVAPSDVGKESKEEVLEEPESVDITMSDIPDEVEDPVEDPAEENTEENTGVDAAANEVASGAHSPRSTTLAFLLVGASWCWMVS